MGKLKIKILLLCLLVSCNGDTDDNMVSSKTGERCSPCPAGPKGERGARGPKGTTGERGSMGSAGYQGQKGEPGPQGQTGNGFPGQKGAIGPQGFRGIMGERGLMGSPGRPGSPGVCSPASCGQPSLHLQVGSPESPATTCKALTRSNGYYYVDPNGGDKADAFQVFCDGNKGTCLRPESELSVDLSFGSNQSLWTRHRLYYKVSNEQLNALQLLSSRAIQTITMIPTSLNPNYQVTLLSWNDLLIENRATASSDTLETYVFDTKDGGRLYTFTVDTMSPRRLPVTDFLFKQIIQRYTVDSVRVILNEICFQ